MRQWAANGAGFAEPGRDRWDPQMGCDWGALKMSISGPQDDENTFPYLVLLFLVRERLFVDSLILA